MKHKKKDHKEKNKHNEQSSQEASLQENDMNTITAEKNVEASEQESAPDYLDHLQRLQAEFDNFRKRTLKEKQMLRSYVLEEVVSGFLPVLDNFRRAMDSFRENEDASSSFAQGVEMIYNQFSGVLKEYGVMEIKAVGEKFDPTIHEAVGSEESEEDNIVLKEMQKGYRLKERVIRPSTVIVSIKGKSTEEMSFAEQDRNNDSEALQCPAED